MRAKKGENRLIRAGNRNVTVSIYSSEKCPSCSNTFKNINGFSCCHGARASRVIIQITGIRDHPRKRVILYSDQDGLPLEPIRAAYLKQVIEKQVVTGVFDWRKYAARTRQNLKWANYARKIYLPWLLDRVERSQKQDDWITLSAYEDYEKYQRLYLIPKFGDFNLDDIDLRMIQHAVNELRDMKGEFASSGIKRKFVDGARHMLNFAYERGDIQSVPAFPTIKRPGRVITTLTPTQQKEILEKIPEKHRPIFLWLTWTGRRINEARAMKINDIDFRKLEYKVIDSFDKNREKPFPKIRSKAGAVLPLDDGIGDKAALLRSVIGDRISGYVFINPNCGKPYTHNMLRRIFEDARKTAGYTISPNEFGRHSWATQRLAEGWTYDQVAMYLLNTATVVEKRYANVNVAVRRAVIKLHQTNKRKNKSEKGL